MNKQEFDNFENVKKAYTDFRYEELKKISRYFSNNKSFVNRRIHRGSNNYKLGSISKEPNSLANWMWFTIERKDVHFIVSLQPFDRDAKTGNHHVLFDQIGIYAYAGDYSADDAFSKMLITDISLPLDEDKLRKLETILEQLSDCEIFKIQVQFKKVCEDNKLIK